MLYADTAASKLQLNGMVLAFSTWDLGIKMALWRCIVLSIIIISKHLYGVINRTFLSSFEFNGLRVASDRSGTLATWKHKWAPTKSQTNKRPPHSLPHPHQGQSCRSPNQPRSPGAPP